MYYALVSLALTLIFAPFKLPANQAPIRPHYAAGEIESLCREAIAEAEAQLNAIAATSAKSRTFDNTVLAFESSLADFDAKTSPLTFMSYVSPVETTVTQSADCDEEVNKFLASIFTRKEVYQALQGMEPRSGIEGRLYSETIKEFERNGMKLPADTLNRVKVLNEKLAVLTAQFSKNLNADKSTLTFSASELQGASNDFLARLERAADDKYVVTTQGPDYIEVMDNVRSGETRQKMLFAYENRAASGNTPLLEQAIEVRQELALLLGYPTWAEYQISANMAKSAKSVLDFLTSLKGKLQKRNREELAQLLKLKQTLDPTATELKPWDIRYFSNQLKKRDYAFDKNVVRDYFPANTVIESMFAVYSSLLGIRLTLVEDANVWAPDVKLYSIEDAVGEHHMGYFYADLFPRPGKYGHAAAFTLIKGRDVNGAYGPTVSAIVANFSPPTESAPALLSHDDVETLFHEFGHIMHQTLTQAPFASLSGTAVAIDFVEAPSQVLENWVWSPEILALLSGHYQRPTEKLPAKLLDNMLRARDFNQGYFYTRQLLFGLLDMEYHTTVGPVDTVGVYNRLFAELFGIAPMEGGHFPASFGHLMGGYDAGYYSYLWSKVFSEDMFTRFQKAGLLNLDVGLQYRRAILEKGNMADAMDLLREFLGREPSTEAFFERLKIH